MTEPEPVNSRNRALVAVSLASVIAVVLIVVLGLVLNPTAGTLAGTRPQPSSASSATPLPSLAPSIIPASCDKVYSTDWATTLAPNVLNPSWSRSAGLLGVDDPALVQILQPNVRLTCVWGAADAQGKNYLITSLAQLTADQVTSAQSRLTALDYNCVEQSGGMRCVIEGTNADGSWGNSEFFRDGVWLATRWRNLGPDGYTSDMVSTLWPQ